MKRFLAAILGKVKFRLLKQFFHGVTTFTLSSALVSCGRT